MDNVDISIVIPSRGRPERLARLVDALSGQILASPLTVEVLIALDGEAPCPLPSAAEGMVQIFALPQVGISAAKNVACSAARGRVVLFLNDDVMPVPGFLVAHASAHAAGEQVVLGAAPWRRHADQTLLDEALARTAMVFFYHRMTCGERYDFRHAWNLNLSVAREWLGKFAGPFDERFRPCMYEDLEFAHRMMGRMPQVYYAKGADVEHDHRYTLSGYLCREALLGLMAPQLAEVNPACFAALFGCTLPALKTRAVEALETDQRDGHRLVAQLPGLAAQPWSGREQALRLFYMAHLPLKRRAFRLGLLAADKALSVDWTVRSQVARDALYADPVFAALGESTPGVTASAAATGSAAVPA